MGLTHSQGAGALSHRLWVGMWWLLGAACKVRQVGRWMHGVQQLNLLGVGLWMELLPSSWIQLLALVQLQGMWVWGLLGEASPKLVMAMGHREHGKNAMGGRMAGRGLWSICPQALQAYSQRCARNCHHSLHPLVQLQPCSLLTSLNRMTRSCQRLWPTMRYRVCTGQAIWVLCLWRWTQQLQLQVVTFTPMRPQLTHPLQAST